jgi:hypothetical protein
VAVSKRLRFEILRRDNHTCYYCGRRPPEVEITIDHVLPQALGGSDEATNLVAACRECNGGKTSIAPGSPLVEQVNEDAIRWSAAMQAAIRKAEEDHEAVATYREQFLNAWNDYKRPADLDENWRASVETFRTRGLPIEMLIDATHRAMAKSNIGLGNKFRYMCGIAWAKVSEIEKHARSIFATETASNEDDEEREPTLKEEILPIIGREAFEASLDEVRRWYDEDEERSEERIEQDAIVNALSDRAIANYNLGRAIEGLLYALVPGAECWEAWDRAGDSSGETEPSGRWRKAAEIVAKDRAAKHLESLAPEQREEWLQYAMALDSGGWGSAGRSEEMLISQAGKVALEIANGWRFGAMCGLAGKHIGYCPHRGTATIAVAGCAECGIEPCLAEVGPLICDAHLEMAIERGIPDRGGHRLAVTDFVVLPPEEEAPF